MNNEIPKPPLDTSIFFNWSEIGSYPVPVISTDGRYIIYRVSNRAAGDTLIIQPVNGESKISLPGVREAAFTDDSKWVCYKSPDGSLYILSISSGLKTCIGRVTNFKVFGSHANQRLVYQKDTSDSELVIYHFASNSFKTYKNVIDYSLSYDEKSMIIQTERPSGDASIEWLNVINDSVKFVYQGNRPSGVLLDDSNRCIALQIHKEGVTKILLYNSISGELSELATDSSLRISKGINIRSLSKFSADCSKLFLYVRQEDLVRPNSGATMVNIWSYTDGKLQSHQLDDIKSGLDPPALIAVINLFNPNSILLLQENNEIVNSVNDDYILTTFTQGEISENYWNRLAVGSTWLISTVDGNRQPLPLSNASFSAGGKYVVGYNADDTLCNMFAYEIATKTTRNITSNIPVSKICEDADMISSLQKSGIYVAGWMPNDNAALIYDEYDIWQIDPKMRRPPINLTNGRIQRWRFRLLSEGNVEKDVILEEKLLLSAFNKQTKQSGFFQLNIRHPSFPKELSKGDFLYKAVTKYNGSIVKARDQNLFLISKESCRESPNLFITADFQHFTMISNVYPEKRYNWLTSELVTFKAINGVVTQAILYKPENFDSTHKYPLIIHYYDKRSEELNKYQRPYVSSGADLDIAWFVSHGYLVLVTDIHFRIGEPGKSVLEAVEGAVLALARHRYVDSTHIGIQGHSFGGWETNYLITHSIRFTAAVSSCGIANITSFYGNVWPGERSKQEYVETRGLRMGIVTPWENPDQYVKNSPIYYVGNVKTPLLMMSNRDDKNVQFEEGLQFFTGLRRAGKRVWLLEYDGGGHGVGGEDYKDYILRTTQFFDHYLKGKQPAKWMTRGIPAKMKGIDDGFKLDDEIKTPGEGLLKNNISR